MVGDDDDFVAIPDLGGLAEFALEDADGAGAADVVGEKDVGLDPHIFAGFHMALAAGAGEQFFGQRHREGERSAKGTHCHPSRGIFALANINRL